MSINAGTIASYLTLDTSKFNSGITSALAQLKTFSNSSATLSDKMNAVSTSINTVGSTMLKNWTVPILGAGIAALKTASDFETSAAKVETIADTSAKSLSELNKGIQKISADTGIAATELNEALYNVISSTGDTANALEYTEIANKAAIGGFTDSATAVDGLTSVMNAYGKQGKAAMIEIADQMLMTQNYGKTTFGELSQSIGQVVPIAATLKVGTNELFAAIATLTKQGIGTSQSMTSMKAALSNVIKPSSEAAEIAKELGIDFSAAALESKGLAGFLNYVATACKGSTEKMSKLFGSTEALNAVLALTSDKGAADMQGALKAMAESAGATESAYEKMSDTFETRSKKLMNNVKNVGVSFGTMLLPVAEKVVGALNSAVTWLNNLDDSTKKAITTTAMVIAVAGPTVLVIGKIVGAISGIMTAVNSIKAASSAMEVLNAVCYANPYVLLATGIAAVSAALVVMALKADDAGRAISESAKESRESWDSLKQSVSTSFSDDATIIRIQALKKQLNNLVDENGKLIGDEATLKGVIRELVENGINVEYDANKKLIKSYGETETAIDSLIAKKRYEMRIAGMETLVQEAEKSRYENAAKYADALENEKSKLDALAKELAPYKISVDDITKAYENNRTALDLILDSGYGMPAMGGAIDKAIASYQSARDATQTFSDVLNESYDTINTYDQILEYGLSGAYDDAAKAADNFAARNSIAAMSEKSLADSSIADMQAEIEKYTSALNDAVKAGNINLAADLAVNLQEAIKVVGEKGGDIPETLKNRINNGLSGLKALGGKIPTDLAEGIRVMLPTVQKQSAKLPENVGIGIKSNSPNAVKQMSTLMSQIKTESNKIDLRPSGINAVSSLQAGINAKKPALLGSVKTLANSVSNALRKALKIASPSKVMMEIGRYTGEGLALGIENTEPEVREAVKGLSAAAMSVDVPITKVEQIQNTSRSESKIDKLIEICENLEYLLEKSGTIELDGRTFGRWVRETVS